MTQPLETVSIASVAASWVPIESLTVWDKNPRKNDPAVPRVAASIARFGFVAPICVWQGAGRMVAGHTRLKAMRKLLHDDPSFVPPGAPGIGLVPVRFHDFTSEAEADLYALADNKLGEIAEWDDVVKDEILSGFTTEDRSVAGFDELTTEPAPRPDEDTIPEPPKVATTRPGDLYIMGEHRLVCGDARNGDVISLAVNGHRPTFGLHDPPYGISVVEKGLGDGSPQGTHKRRAARGKFRPIFGDSEPFDPTHLLELSDVVFLWGANHYADKLPARASWVVWDKRDGMVSNDLSDGELAWVNRGGRVKIIRHLWNGYARASERGELRVHPTQKPVIVIRTAVEDYTREGDLVLDCYGGSGTTLIACEGAKRRCSMVEIDPGYCDVIVERWQRLTGLTAERVPATT